MSPASIAEIVGTVLELVGIAAITAGGVAATIDFARARLLTLDERYLRYRRNLGRAILLGLEFLVAADIIATVAIQPSIESVAILAGIVLIRTVLSFALETEISGRAPWARDREREPH